MNSSEKTIILNIDDIISNICGNLISLNLDLVPYGVAKEIEYVKDRLHLIKNLLDDMDLD